MVIENKLSRVRFHLDANAHIRIDTEICRTCIERHCLFVCPVENYSLIDNKITFNWQGCLECGSCRIVCRKGAIDWNFPRGGYGVDFRYG